LTTASVSGDSRASSRVERVPFWRITKSSRRTVRQTAVQPTGFAVRFPSGIRELNHADTRHGCIETFRRNSLAISRSPWFCRKTFCAKPFAFSLPQDSPLGLMFGARQNRRSGSKCFAALEFRNTPRTAHRPRTLLNRTQLPHTATESGAQR
jgi:hypothetical protein